jgi:hypothetical protein
MRSSPHTRALGLALLAAVVASCDAPSVAPEEPGYDPTQLTGGQVYRWEQGRTIAVYVDETDAPEGFDLAAATGVAVARWNAVARYGQYELATTPRSSEADVVIRFRFAPSIVDLMDCEPAGSGAGRTAFCTDTSPVRVLPFLGTGGGRVKVEVYVDPEAATDAQLQAFGVTRQQFFQGLVTHEFGHVLGIGGHSGDPADVMNGFPRVQAPSADDVRALDWVWLRAPDLLL